MRLIYILSEAEQRFSFTKINTNAKWKRNGLTIAGGNGQGSELNQLCCPCGIFLDDDSRCLYIVDSTNHRV